jgi:hypothetical protein
LVHFCNYNSAPKWSTSVPNLSRDTELPTILNRRSYGISNMANR